MVISLSKRSKRFVFLVAISFVGLYSQAAEYMSLKDVKPGMKGVGKTVFRGTQVEDFDVEIIGVVENFIPGKDLILVRVGGGVIDEAGVIEGMSGSPVYVDGKLIGAMAYKFGAFQKEPIGGVTPIEEMLRIFEPGHEQGGIHMGEHGVVPIGTPLTVAGFHPNICDEIANACMQFGFVPVSTGTPRGESMGEFSAEPGAVIGLSLIRGDAEMSAIGTLTLVEGDKVIGFGHGAFVGGKVDLPLVAGYVHSVIPSSFMSYKLASGCQVIGKITADRVVGVGGRLGARARLIPATVKVGSTEGEETYQYEIVQYKLMTPLLVNWIAKNSLLASIKATGDCTVSGEMKVVVGDTRTVRLRNVFAGSNAIDEFGRWVYQPIERLLNNQFGEQEISSIELNVSMKEEVEKVRILSVKLNRTSFKQSDTLVAEVELLSLDGDRYTEEFFVPMGRVPEGVGLEVQVSSSDTLRAQEMQRWPRRFSPTSPDHLIRLIEDAGSSDELELRVLVGEEVVQLKGIDLPFLPSSVRGLFHAGKIADETVVTTGYPLFSVRRRLVHPISGFETIEVKMEGAVEEPETNGGRNKK